MDKYIYDESNGRWYELQGDYYIPFPYFTGRKRAQAYRLMGAATQTLFTGT